MVLREAGGKRPALGDGVYVDESAVVIGDVRLGGGASVWPAAVVRADDDRVEVGKGSAVLDMAFIEAPRGRPVTIGEGCLVSHCARLHGCTLGRSVLVGIGAIVLDGARVGDGAVVAAGSLVPPGAEVQPRTVVMGVPAKASRSVGPTDLETLRSELETLRAKAALYAAQK
jgi:carbonic anhydrase/acetyltransferase-like protein (isoleucine patch superfamily)